MVICSLEVGIPLALPIGPDLSKKHLEHKLQMCRESLIDVYKSACWLFSENSGKFSPVYFVMKALVLYGDILSILKYL